ncbi:alpha/beta hydrolase [Nocardia otitidiscaviarum]|uniref:alpha/beta fold hydrolase n=1 Tax=Nocardia otitidiscaviarum TaxID=1823 RepID=UPI001894F245|nr:alpha/beta hydrolase [Nocardia otitidiscaviarum]MBF6238278.1 alpha/beta hydrolase [Nocardia otitidiscaviarum]
MPFVTTDDGVDIHYLDTGGDGPAVLLVHDILLDATQWQPQLESLAPDYRVIAVDTRGHGETDDLGKPFDYSRLARDCWAVADALGLDDTVLGGLFHGGIVALWAAWLAPARVRGLLLIGTRADAYNPEEYAGYRSILLDQWVLGDQPLDPIVRPIAAQMIGGDNERRDYWLEKWNASDRRRLEQAIIALLEREGIEDRIHEITAPALLMHGAGDVVYTDYRMRALAGKLGGPTRFETVDADGATHAITWTHPHLTDPLIRDFLDNL